MAQSTVKHPVEDVVDLSEEAPIRVLHVDDEAGFLKVAKQILEMQGAFQVDTASSVEEAMEKMKQTPYDVIVSDYIMPGKDGLQFLKELRDSGNNIPFIIFTGKGREEVAIQALNLGADRYFNKIGKPETVYYELAHSIRQTVERKKADLEVWKREERLRAILASSPDIITVSDLQGNIIDCNEVTWKLMGFSSKEELLGKSSFEFIAEKDRKRALENLKKTFEQTTISNVEYTLLNRDGEEYIGELSTSILKDSSGNPIGFVGVARNITERKKAEEALRQSEEKYKNIFELAPDGIITIDLKGVITSVNPTFLKLTGYSKEEIVGKHFTKLGTIRARDIPRYLKLMSSALRGKLPTKFDYSYVRKDGTVGWAEGHFGILRKNGKVVGFQGVLRELTERKKAYEELRSSEERLRILFESAPDAIYINDLKGNFVDGNKAAEELIGYSRNELIGKSFLKLGILSRRQIPKAAKLLAKNVFGKPTGPDEFVLNRKDNTQVPVEIRTFPVKIKGQTLVLGIARDITQRKEAMKRLKILNEKLGVVGKLTRHDARNKLSTVIMNTYMFKQKLADDPEALKHLSEVESACRDVEQIFDFARVYEKIGSEELEYIGVAKTIEEVIRLFSDLQNVRVTNDCSGLTVLADSLLRQLFYNLIDNSLKHGGKVSHIRVYCQEKKKAQLKLVYEDDGVGIPKAEKKKIFNEGYGKGSGYGLYLIRKMCEVYGWSIRETGKQGKGARFTMTIPKVGGAGKINYKLH